MRLWHCSVYSSRILMPFLQPHWDESANVYFIWLGRSVCHFIDYVYLEIGPAFTLMGAPAFIDESSSIAWSMQSRDGAAAESFQFLRMFSVSCLKLKLRSCTVVLIQYRWLQRFWRTYFLLSGFLCMARIAWCSECSRLTCFFHELLRIQGQQNDFRKDDNLCTTRGFRLFRLTWSSFG